MEQKRFWAAAGKLLAATAATLIIVSILAPGAWAVSEKVLHSFTGGDDGYEPHQGLAVDAVGNLYGTTFVGGAHGAGTVFKLTPNLDGTWTESVLHDFTGRRDGGYVDWGTVAFDPKGNLYGAAYEGGNYGAGVLFRLTPNGDGTWAKSIVHQFTGGKDGGWPRTTPYFDAQGTLYGTAAYGGSHGCGTVFKIENGAKSVIHQFMDKPACSPWVGLTSDSVGNLYGTTRNAVGGCNPPNECGTVFELTPAPNGKWTFEVIHRFVGGDDGSDPSVSGLIIDDAGNLYGTTEHAGPYDSGVLFSLTPGENQKWSYRVLHAFNNYSDGSCATGHLVRDPVGNIFGTACLGGAYGYGTVYKLTPNLDETWTFSVVYAFSGSDGANPVGNLLLDEAGDLFGVTASGGSFGAGAVYEIVP